MGDSEVVLDRPETLELTAADALVAVENIDTIRKNGFELDISEHTGSEDHVGHIKLTAKPISKDTVFGLKGMFYVLRCVYMQSHWKLDLEELISLLRDKPAGHMVRCSKARAMFAMRACRKSVMIGKALNKTQMTSVCSHFNRLCHWLTVFRLYVIWEQ